MAEITKKAKENKTHRFYWEERERGIMIEVPGFSKDEIKVSVENDIVRVTAAKRSRSERQGKTFYHAEESAHSLMRSFSLPENLNADNLDINITDGSVSIRKKKARKHAE